MAWNIPFVHTRLQEAPPTKRVHVEKPEAVGKRSKLSGLVVVKKTSSQSKTPDGKTSSQNKTVEGRGSEIAENEGGKGEEEGLVPSAARPGLELLCGYSDSSSDTD